MSTSEKLKFGSGDSVVRSCCGIPRIVKAYIHHEGHFSLAKRVHLFAFHAHEGAVPADMYAHN